MRILALALLLVAAVGCLSPGLQAAVDRRVARRGDFSVELSHGMVQAGMTGAEVRSVLGPPDSTETSPNAWVGHFLPVNVNEVWRYGDREVALENGLVTMLVDCTGADPRVLRDRVKGVSLCTDR